MTNEELQAIVATVVQELQNSGTEITGTAVQNSLNKVSYLLGLNGTALVRVSPGVVNEGESKNATAIAEEIERAVAEDKALGERIAALSAGAKVIIDIAPKCVYKGQQASVYIDAMMVGAVPTSMKIVDGTGNVIGSVQGNSLRVNKGLNITGDAEFTAVAIYADAEFKTSATLYARYPVYAGFGVSSVAVAVAKNKLTARTSAVGTYSGVADIPVDEAAQRFYILVPNDIPGLNSFTMGGAPLVMTATTEIINGITYNVYRSGAKYANGATVTIKAE